MKHPTPEQLKQIAQRIWDGDYANVDELAQAIEVVAREQLAEIERLQAEVKKLREDMEQYDLETEDVEIDRLSER